MTSTLTQIANRALRDIGCLRPGQTTSTDVLNDILTRANEMIDGWLLEELMTFTLNIAAYTLVAGTRTYKIGPGQVAPNIAAARPTQVMEANIIINTVSPVVRRPMKILDHKEWAAIRVQDIPFALPLQLYYDKGFDATNQFGTLYLWPGPLSSYQLELFTWQQLQSFPDLVTALNFPPGYEQMIRTNLAVLIAPMMRMYAKVPQAGGMRDYDPNMLALVVEQAQDSKRLVESYNSMDPGQPGDLMYSSRTQHGAFNYGVGENN